MVGVTPGDRRDRATYRYSAVPESEGRTPTTSRDEVASEGPGVKGAGRRCRGGGSEGVMNKGAKLVAMGPSGAKFRRTEEGLCWPRGEEYRQG